MFTNSQNVHKKHAIIVTSILGKSTHMNNNVHKQETEVNIIYRVLSIEKRFHMHA